MKEQKMNTTIAQGYGIAAQAAADKKKAKQAKEAAKAKRMDVKPATTPTEIVAQGYGYAAQSATTGV